VAVLKADTDTAGGSGTSTDTASEKNSLQVGFCNGACCTDTHTANFFIYVCDCPTDCKLTLKSAYFGNTAHLIEVFLNF